VKKWVRNYQLNRGRQFTVSDQYELTKVESSPTSLNYITYCNVTELAPGQLSLKGEGFELTMKYNSKALDPKIEFIEVTDDGLKRYWPRGITRIVFTMNNPGLNGKDEIVITPNK